MRTFRATDGTEYRVNVNVLTIKRVLEETGLRLTDLFADERAIGQFFSDDVRFAEVVLATIRPQLVEAKRSPDEFFASLDGTVIQAAAEALLAEVADFFQEPRRTMLRRVMERYQAAADKVRTEVQADVDRRLETINFEAALRQMYSPPTPTSSASSSPDSAESSPGGTRSAS